MIFFKNIAKKPQHVSDEQREHLNQSVTAADYKYYLDVIPVTYLVNTTLSSRCS